MGMPMYNPRRTLRTHPDFDHRDNFLAAAVSSIPSAEATYIGVKNRADCESTVANSIRPLPEMPAGTDIESPALPYWVELLALDYH